METSRAVDWIEVTGARTHNLCDLKVRFPRHAVVAFAGVSGSGKTSLAIDTLHAEAQLRYIEGLAPFVRQYISPRNRPQVDRITGLGATLAVDQRHINRNARSTLATLTGLDAYLSLLYSRLPALAEERGDELSSTHFDRYSTEGSCARCNGVGARLQADPALIITNPAAPLSKGASAWFDRLYSGEQAAVPFLAARYEADLDRPWRELPEGLRHALLYGTGDEPVSVSLDLPNKNSDAEVTIRYNKPLRGALAEVERLFAAARTENAKKRYVRYLRMDDCAECGGTGYGAHARTVLLGGLCYADVMLTPVRDACAWADRVGKKISPGQQDVAQVLLPELAGRLDLLRRLGLGHIQLSRSAPTMSGGELQRARITGQLSSGLTGIAYILDEPTCGLHPLDKVPLADTIKELRDAGNTVLLVEHDTELIAAADWVVEVGPGAGEEGGRLVASCPPAELASYPQSRTAPYLTGTAPHAWRTRREASHGWITLTGLRSHNLRIPRLRFPKEALTSLTGVSGSGKSSVLHDCIGAGVSAALNGHQAPSVADISGIEGIGWVRIVDQDPIGRTPRSNPATYSKALDIIRTLFASTDAAVRKGLRPSAFSFNSTGRCGRCSGYGRRLVDMHFLPDVSVVCEACGGRRFSADVLSVRYRGLSIDEVLELTVDAAALFFAEPAPLASILATLQRVGLGYLRLGQSSTELSGGEAQRLKLAATISQSGRGKPGLVLLDEPVTGLHPADVQRLVDAFDVLLAEGSTVVIAEHDLHVAAVSDWIIDLGPGSGAEGGRVCGEGRPETVAASTSPSSRFLQRLIRPKDHSIYII